MHSFAVVFAHGQYDTVFGITLLRTTVFEFIRSPTDQGLSGMSALVLMLTFVESSYKFLQIRLCIQAYKPT